MGLASVGFHWDLSAEATPNQWSRFEIPGFRSVPNQVRSTRLSHSPTQTETEKTAETCEGWGTRRPTLHLVVIIAFRCSANRHQPPAFMLDPRRGST